MNGEIHQLRPDPPLKRPAMKTAVGRVIIEGDSIRRNIVIHDKLVAGCFWRPYLDAIPDFLSNEALLCYSEPP
jgi:hypothetical protein